MTVGIAAICRKNGEPTALIAADRMVTVGQQGGVEYEDTESKLEATVENDSVATLAVGAGASTYIDEIFRLVPQLVNQMGQPLTTVDQVRDSLVAAYQMKVRETIENQVTQPFGYTLNDLKDQDINIPPSLQQRFTEEVDSILEEVNKRVHLILTGVGEDGAKVYQISGMDYNNFTDIGYSIVGSGSDSARLTFIRRQYDRTCTYREGVFTVLEAKKQAEERRGVGQQTDIAMIDPDGIDVFDPNERAELKDKLSDVEDAERAAREDVMEDWDS